MTLANYIETSIPAIPEGDQNAANQLANIEHKKPFALLDNISTDIFNIVSEAATYDNAI